MEIQMNYASWVDTADFGTVRRYLRSAKSPVSGVLFVAPREVLAQAAALLDAGSERSVTLRERQLRWLFETGHIRPGVDAVSAGQGTGVDMERISDEAFCSVIYLPPVYLVHLPGLCLNKPGRPE
jgi:hypothetical protein